MTLVTASIITDWANKHQKQCQQLLPELIARLILANASLDAIERIVFPSGDGTTNPGWDGYLTTSAAHPFFPSGISGWEIGADKSAGSKAEGDYTKRTEDPKDLNPKESTFVFVTPRPWPGRSDWIKAKKAEKVWQDVKVINAHDLERWLVLAPAVELWLARKMGLISHNGIRGIEEAWEEYSNSRRPVLTTSLIIAGRNKDVELVRNWLSENPEVLSLRGDHPSESFAFLYSAIDTFPKTERDHALSRCIVVNNPEEMIECKKMFPTPQIIAAPASCADLAGDAVAKGHHVFICADATFIGIHNLHRLTRPKRSVVAEELEKMGFNKKEAQQVARDFGRSIPVLARHLSVSNSFKSPEWASSEASELLLPILFAGSWNETKQGDINVLEMLAGMKYEDFIKKIRPYLNIDDSPIQKIGELWTIKSSLDAWFLLAQFANKDILNKFKTAIISVLTKTDPKYELSQDKQWAAAIYGKSNPYSNWLRTGLVESLVLIAVYGDRSEDMISTQGFADQVVSEIFSNLKTWEAWASIKDVTPLLAEAAPDKYMDYVEKTYKDNPNIFIELMKDDDSLFGECRHSGLLWALEGLAWSPKYFGRSVKILYNLSKIDPGGRWANRPMGSLKDIFVPQIPQTNTTPTERLEALNLLIEQDAAFVWLFIKDYYIEGGFLTESHKFQWRYDNGERKGLESETIENIQVYLKGLYTIVKDLSTRKENLVSSFDDFNRLPKELQDLLIDTLIKTDPELISKEERSKILQNIRDAMNWINSYGDEQKKKNIAKLDKLLAFYSPKDVIERVGWLLSTPWPKLPQGDRKNYKSQDAEARKLQEEAAREMLDQTTIEDIFKFAYTVQYPGVIGHALGTVVKDKEDPKLLDFMLKNVDKNKLIIRAYSGARTKIKGANWIENQIERLKEIGKYSDKGAALLFFGLPEERSAWNAVNLHGTNVEIEYWKEASGYSARDNNDDVQFAVKKLLSVKRPGAALELAGNPKVSLPSSLLQELINALFDIEKFVMRSMDEYHISFIFKQLYDRNELSLIEIAKLEWPFARIFDQIQAETKSPMAIHRLLQNDPAFFAQIVSFYYKPEDRSSDPDQAKLDKKQIENRARGAREVLNSWYLIPGLKETGAIDGKVLRDWIIEARSKCAEAKRATVGDREIAKILSHSPYDLDGIWPHTTVRDMIEYLNNDVIDRHILTEVRNSRGVVTRSPGEGGRQERELAEKYNAMSEKVKVKWPRTASLLRSIAESYIYEAKREDLETDIRELRWD